MSIYEESLKFHKELKGKLEITSRVKINNEKDLSLAYTPGVAEPCREINGILLPLFLMVLLF